MKMPNATHYDTAALRRIAVEAHRRLAKHEGRLRTWKRLTMDVSYARQQDRCTGYAYFHGRYMKLRVARRDQSAAWFAWLVTHELMHSYGYDHSRFSDQPISSFAWATELVGEVIPARATPKPKPRPDIKAVRFERLLTRRAAWTSKRKRADTALAKLKVQIRGYERRQAAEGEAA